MPTGQTSHGGRLLDPNSGRSEAKGVVFTALPAEGYKGKPPTYPLPAIKLFKFEEDADTGRRYQVYDAAATKEFQKRERALWKWVWTTPQAAAWAQQSEVWRLHTVGMWVRTAVVCEGSNATAADKNSLHRFADGIGLTTIGLRTNGWQISAIPIKSDEETPPAAGGGTRSRLAVVKGA